MNGCEHVLNDAQAEGQAAEHEPAEDGIPSTRHEEELDCYSMEAGILSDCCGGDWEVVQVEEVEDWQRADPSLAPTFPEDADSEEEDVADRTCWKYRKFSPVYASLKRMSREE